MWRDIIYNQAHHPTTMIALTTRQRDLLQLLLEAGEPISSADIAEQMQITTRQVNYGLKGIKQWLAQRDVRLQVTPGIGVELGCSPTKYQSLQEELKNQADFQLILSAEQRQQLFALHLLFSSEPFILYQFQQMAQVSRTTILKDLDGLLPWLSSFELTMQRRPNYGIWIEGDEQSRRQALVTLLWGDVPFDSPLFHMTHNTGLQFDLETDAKLLPILESTSILLDKLDTQKTLSLVAYAEAHLGGRFTDNTVLHIALALAIQTTRMISEQFLPVPASDSSWLQTHPAWPVALRILDKLYRPQDEVARLTETSSIGLQLLAGAKNERWPGDLENDTDFAPLISKLVEKIGLAYEMPDLSKDSTLRDGLIANVIPACLRQRYGLWSPVTSQPHQLSAEKYAFEYQLAYDLGSEITEQTGLILPEHDLANLTFLLRAAYIRERPHSLRDVIVVCPSGMATAQLLVARLKARFPRLGELTVLSMRELNEARLAQADLVITTVPLNHLTVKVLQVHPLLLPEDISAITQWLS